MFEVDDIGRGGKDVFLESGSQSINKFRKKLKESLNTKRYIKLYIYQREKKLLKYMIKMCDNFLQREKYKKCCHFRKI